MCKLSMKKFSVFAISALLYSIAHGAQFIVVECYAYPNGYAYFSVPITGMLHRANSCGEALVKVPHGYYLLSSVAAGEKNTSGVKYLFSDTPTPGG